MVDVGDRYSFKKDLDYSKLLTQILGRYFRDHFDEIEVNIFILFVGFKLKFVKKFECLKNINDYCSIKKDLLIFQFRY